MGKVLVVPGKVSGVSGHTLTGRWIFDLTAMESAQNIKDLKITLYVLSTVIFKVFTNKIKSKDSEVYAISTTHLGSTSTVGYHHWARGNKKEER